jgi:hypothetical protein
MKGGGAHEHQPSHETSEEREKEEGEKEEEVQDKGQEEKGIAKQAYCFKFLKCNPGYALSVPRGRGP